MTRWVSALVATCVVVFILQQRSPELTPAFMWLPALGMERPWTAVTYMFLHGGFGHVLFNMIALYMFGPRVEARIGPDSAPSRRGPSARRPRPDTETARL